MFDALTRKGFQIVYQAHAKAILGSDFPDAATELEAALDETTIPIEEIIAGGGGEAKGTQRLRRALAATNWLKTTFVVEKRINDVPRQSQSHEVDHVRAFADGSRIALEIEWNNKDPFYDRDLENFKRLHADGAISIGIIPAPLDIDTCPVTVADGFDSLRIVDEEAPSALTCVQDIFVGVPDEGGELVLAQICPDIFHRVQLG